MIPNKPDNLAGGECSICGLPGIIGMHCDDPECTGTVVGLQEPKKVKEAGGDIDEDRYSDDLLKEAGVVESLEDIAEKEIDSNSDTI